MGLISKRVMRRILYCACLAVLIAIVAMFTHFNRMRARKAELTYGGATFDYLLGELTNPTSEQKRERARRVIRELGTNALPFLIARLSYKDHQIGRLFESLQSRIHPRDFSRQDEVRSSAIAGFEVLGPAACPAIPE